MCLRLIERYGREAGRRDKDPAIRPWKTGVTRQNDSCVCVCVCVCRSDALQVDRGYLYKLRLETIDEKYVRKWQVEVFKDLEGVMYVQTVLASGKVLRHDAQSGKRRDL